MKNKILPIVLLIFIISLSFICPVYASNVIPDDVPEYAELVVEKDYILIKINSNDTSNGDIYLLTFNEETAPSFYVDGNWFYINQDNSGVFSMYSCCSGKTEWTSVYENTSYPYSFSAYEKAFVNSFVSSNVNIYDTENNLVFQEPPQSTLAPIVEGTKTKKVMAEILGILPLIIVTLVSFLGFRKALKMLLTVLRQS